jgi:glycosyltransferase 2 family protein
VTRLAAVLALVGLALATALVAREGAGAVLGAVGAVGAGVLWVSALHALPMALNARAWQLLAGRGGRGGARALGFWTWLVWVREAVNGLLPVARVGGEVVTARLLVARGVRPAPAVASLVADVIVSLATQALFTVIGVALVAGGAASAPVARAAWASLVLAAAVLAAVAVAQRRGAVELLGRAARAIAGRRFEALAASGRRTDRVLRAVWGHRSRVLRCGAWQLAGWLAGSLELAVCLWLLGDGLRLRDALVLEALVQAASSAAFVVPGALGVQEGAFLAVGYAVGLPPSTALALALLRRARDVLVFVPALLLWQAQEGRRLFAARG